MPLWRKIRTYVITPPFSAFCFAMFWACGLVVYPFDPKKRGMYLVGWFWSWLLLRTAGVRIVKRGFDGLSGTEPYVYVSNHLSLADTPLMYACLPGPFRFIAKESLMKVPIIGGHLQRAGHISVAREDARSAVKSLAEAGKILDSADASVLVFAEGSRAEGETQSFKGGAAHLAIKSGRTVVPLALSGTNEVMPKGAHLLRPGTVWLTAGAPVATAGMTARDRDGLTERLQSEVERMLGSIRNAG